MGWGDDLDMYQQLEGGLRSMRIAQNTAHVRPWSKNGSKTKNLKDTIGLSCLQHSIRLVELIILMWSVVKIGQKMVKLCPFKVVAKVASWPILG